MTAPSTPEQGGSHPVRICSTKDIARGSGKSFKVGALDLAIFHTEDGFFATCDICTHEHEHLSEGWLESHLVECPRHGAQFDLRTGEAVSLPATEDLEIYPLTLEGDDVMVSIPHKYLLPSQIGS